MAWGDEVPQLSKEALETLTSWALGQKAEEHGDQFDRPDIPDNIILGGPGRIIDYAVVNFSNTDAGKFWAALQDLNSTPDNHIARDVSSRFFETVDWRPGFAIGALRALDTRSPWDSGSILMGLEVARGILTYPPTLSLIMHGAGMAENINPDAPLAPRYSPFSNPIVREVLDCMDAVVTAQEYQPGRRIQVLSDIRGLGTTPILLLQEALQIFNTSFATMPGPVGSNVITLLRGLMEDAISRQQLDLTQALLTHLMTLATRYGHTRDWLHSAHRCAFTNFIIYSDIENAIWVASFLEHLLAGALWIEDADLEATVHHGLGLVLRSGPRRIPGMIDGVRHFQRAINLRRQIGETVASLGAQIDLTSILIQISPFANLLVDAPTEVTNWNTSAEAYLEDSIDRLANEEDPVSRMYLGEAFFNRARLFQITGRKKGTAVSARAALGIAEETGNKDLKARAFQVLSEVVPGPEKAINYRATAARLVQTVRKNIADEQMTVAWVGNKQGLFDSQLDYIMNEGREIMSEASVCASLINALEEGRGLTYNRWLGVEKNATIGEVQKALEGRPDTVLAVYAVTHRQVGIILLTASEEPRLHLVDIGAGEVDRMVEQHLSGLNQQGWTCLPLWKTFQAGFLKFATVLTAPLEPFIESGKNICLIPHRTLHAVPLHTVPTKPGGISIGLRVPVFSNPSLTNWLKAQEEAKNMLQSKSQAACVAGAWPSGEKNRFNDVVLAAKSLERAGFLVNQLGGVAANVAAISNNGSPWQILHLACHGVFRRNRGIYGLMLAANGKLPPPPIGEIRDDKLDTFLITPRHLRESRLAGRVTFLASCVSARSEELPGDDLMGISRALFANGTVDLVAGGWTIVSEYIRPFIQEFYSSLNKGKTTAEAMLSARQHLAKNQPDPFFWGCFIHQGANTRLANKGG